MSLHLPRSPRSVSASRSGVEKLKGAFPGLTSVEKKWSSYHQQVLEKLRKHPDYARAPTREVKILAQKLTETDLMEEFFADVLQFQVAQYSVLRAAEEEGERDPEADPEAKPAGPRVEEEEEGERDPEAKPGGSRVVEQDLGVSVDELKVTEGVAGGLEVSAQANGATADTYTDGTSLEAPPPDQQLESFPSRVKDLASFPVKLFLTPLPAPRNDRELLLAMGGPAAAASFTSMLEDRYGPMRAALQFGNTMIEWTPHNLVIPHSNIPSTPTIKTDITRSMRVASELRAKAREYKTSQRGTITGEVDLMVAISASIQEIVRKVIQTIVSWNRYKSYDVYCANSQHFAETVIKNLGIENLPLHNPDFTKYVEELKGKLREPPSPETSSFRDHAQLDHYVRERQDGFSTGEMEYLLTQYYRLHLASREGHLDTAGEWSCEVKECQMQSLEQAINSKELLITSLPCT